MNGRSILIQNVDGTASEEKCVNVLGMGVKSLFCRRRVYKDTMYKSLLEEWSKETAIPEEHLTVYHFTQGKNGTMKANRLIQVDLREEFKGDGDWTDDEIKRHLVRTSPTKKRFGSIYDRIGNIMEKKRSFVLLDDRKITTLQGPKSENNARTILVALKYFDILAQKMYFVDWLRIKTTSITFADISKYVESELIPDTMANGGCLQSLYDLNVKMSEFEAKSNGDEQPKYQFYEEEASYPLTVVGMREQILKKYDDDISAGAVCFWCIPSAEGDSQYVAFLLEKQKKMAPYLEGAVSLARNLIGPQMREPLDIHEWPLQRVSEHDQWVEVKGKGLLFDCGSSSKAVQVNDELKRYLLKLQNDKMTEVGVLICNFSRLVLHRFGARFFAVQSVPEKDLRTKPQVQLLKDLRTKPQGPYKLDDPVTNYFDTGDIFVFQINPFHPYFSALNPAEIGDPQNVMIHGNQNQQRLPLHFQHRIQEFEKKGVSWCCTSDEFIKYTDFQGGFEYFHQN